MGGIRMALKYLKKDHVYYNAFRNKIIILSISPKGFGWDSETHQSPITKDYYIYLGEL
jgi:hypothetical protein